MDTGGCCTAPHTDAGSAIFTQLIQTLMATQCLLTDNSIYPSDAENLSEEYDFIVVGGGSAGSVVANRLSEVSKWSVLLIEAGGDPSVASKVPYLFYSLQNTEEDWAYRTEPQQHACQGMMGKRCSWPRGKVLGGSSSINCMLYVRGNKKDYDGWAALGNSGWSYKDVLGYFKKSESIKTQCKLNSPYHGKNGPMAVSRFGGIPEPEVSSIISAAREFSMYNDDINGPKQSGFTILDGTVENGQRVSTADAFLAPAKDRRNLHVLKCGLVTKILFDNIKRAKGIEYMKNGRKCTFKAKKEVILSAGAVNTPQLLMLSGIGPKEHLVELGIPVIANLRVGFNLQDHLFTFAPTFKFYHPADQKCQCCAEQGKVCRSGQTIPFAAILEAMKQQDEKTKYSSPALQQQAFLYLASKSGMLSGMGALAANGFINTKYADSTCDHPDVQYHFWVVPKGEYGPAVALGMGGVGFTTESMDSIFGAIEDSHGMIMASTLLHPKSIGRIKLRSKDPTQPPIIDPNYLSEQRDVDTLVEGIKFAIEFVTCSRALGEGLCACMVSDPLPSCAHITHGTDDYWGCVVRHLSSTVYHPVGTAKMGPATDPESVVDDNLRVRGVQRLRVIDASVMPKIVSGNTNAPVIMIGEKGAALVKMAWPF